MVPYIWILLDSYVWSGAVVQFATGNFELIITIWVITLLARFVYIYFGAGEK